MPKTVLTLRTSTPGRSPAPGSLQPGQFAIEMADPTRLWVGVPGGAPDAMQKLLLSSDPADNALATAGYLPLSGGTVLGLVTVDASPPASTWGPYQIDLRVGGLTSPYSGIMYLSSDTNAPVISLLRYSNGLWISYGNATNWTGDIGYFSPTGIDFKKPLTLASDPTSGRQAATKNYVDSRTPIISDAPNNTNSYGRKTAAWAQVPSHTSIGGGTFNPDTDIPAGYVGTYQITNQTGASGWPADNGAQTAFILAGWNSNTGWPNKLMMGGYRHNSGMMPLWFMTNDHIWELVLTGAGGKMNSGKTIALGMDPTTAMHAATKQYVDAASSAADGKFLPLVGGTLSGPLTIVAPVATGGYSRNLVLGDSVGTQNPALLFRGQAANPTVYLFQRYSNNLYLSYQATYGTGAATDLFRISNTSAEFFQALTLRSNLTGQGALFNGPVTSMSGLGFGSAVAANVNDMSRHIALYGTTFGFNVTAARLNYNAANTSDSHYFRTGNVDRVQINNSGITMMGGMAITLAQDPVLPMHAANRLWVEESIAAETLFQGTWDPATNTPDIMNDPPPRDGYTWIVSPAPPGGIVVATPGLPGLTGLEVYVGDHLYWDTNISQWERVRAGDLSYQEGIELFVPLAGGTMEGPLYLYGAPTQGLEAATKAYADSKLDQGAADLRYLKLTGGNLTGGISFNNAVVSSATDLSKHISLYNGYGFSVTGSTLNIVSGIQHHFTSGTTLVARISTAGLTMLAGDVALLRDPTAALQAATKQYVDNRQPLGGPYLPLAGGVISGNLSVTPGYLFVGPGGTTVANTTGMIVVSGAVSTYRAVYFQTSGSQRWQIQITNNAEGGSNAGSDFKIGRFSDTGSYISDPVVINRASGLVTVSAGLTVSAGAVTLAADPTATLHAATKQYVDARNPAGSYLPLAGGNMTGIITMTGQNAIQFLNNSQYIKNTGQDGAWLAASNFAIGSWNGVGIPTTCPAQGIPVGLYGAVLDARWGSATFHGNLFVTSSIVNGLSQIQTLKIYRPNATDQAIELSSLSVTAALTSATPAAGGTGCAVNDRFYDAYNNIYTATAVTGGAVTTIRMDSTRARIAGAVPANPIALTAAPGFTGTGVTVNLTWTMPTRLVVQHTSGQVAFYGSAGITLNGGSAGTSIAAGAFTLFNEPTAAKHAATKAYVDSLSPVGKYLLLTGGTMSGGISFGSVTGANAQDMSKHILLYSTLYGFNVTGYNLNYNVPASSNHTFWVGGIWKAQINTTGITMGGGSAITLSQPPTADMHATNKLWVEDEIAAQNLYQGTWDPALNVPPLMGPPAPADGFTWIVSPAPTSGIVITWDLPGLTGLEVYSGDHLIWDTNLSIWERVRAGDLSYNEGIELFLQLTGGTLSGPLYLYGAPTQGLEAATKAYTDLKVAKTGDTMSGALRFGATAVATPNDFSKHIELFSGWGGFTIMSSRLNIVHNGSTYICQGATDQAYFNNNGMTFLGTRTVTLGADPASAMQAATKQYVDNNTITTAAGDARWVNVAGDTMTGALYVATAVTATTSQLSLSPNNVVAQESKLRFRATFVSGTDVAPRLAASLRAGMTAFWGSEYLDVWLGFTTNDANSDANQKKVVRFTNTGLTISSGMTLTLAADPTSALHAATKQYVDNNTISTAAGDARWVNVAGDTMTGKLTINLAAPTTTTDLLVLNQPLLANGQYALIRLGQDGNTNYKSAYLGFIPNATANQSALAIGVRGAGVDTLTLRGDNTATFLGGIRMGTRVGSGPGDTTQHIQLHTGLFGFGITSSRLNYIVPATSSHFFWVGADKVQINSTGLAMLGGATLTLAQDPTAALHAATKQYVDVRDPSGKYLLLTGGTLSGPLTISASTTSGAGGWGAYNYGKQLVVYGVNTNPAIAIADSASTNFIALINSGGKLVIAEMPPLTDNTTPPTNLLQLDSASNCIAYRPWTFNSTAAFSGQATFSGASPAIAVNGNVQTWRTIAFNTAGVARFHFQVNTGAESGGNAGSDFVINRFADNGASLGPTFTYTRSSGLITLGAGLTVSAGAVNVTSGRVNITLGGLSLGSSVGSGPTDLSKHLMLYGSQYGFSVTSGTLNIVSGATISFYPISGVRTGRWDTNGLTLDAGKNVILAQDPAAPMHAATKQYVDNKVPLGGPYLPLTGGRLTGSLIAPYIVAHSATSTWGTDGQLWFGAWDDYNWRLYTGTEGNANLVQVNGSGTWYPSISFLANGTGVIIYGYASAYDSYYIGSSNARWWSDSNCTYLSWDGGVWRWQYYRATGEMSWVRGYDNVVNFSIDPSGYCYAAQAFIAPMIKATSARVIAEGTWCPSLAMSNVAQGQTVGFWQDPSCIRFGWTDAGGSPTGAWGYFDAATFGHNANTVSYTCDAGANAVMWGNYNSFSVPYSAWKPGGGAWADSSDARIKTVIGDYASGLAEIMALRPVRYTFNGNWVTDDSSPRTIDGIISPHAQSAKAVTEYIGLIAQEAEIPMPEMVTRRAAIIDGKPVDDMRVLDPSALPFAIVNAIKELVAMNTALAARVETLEARTLH
jgi:hypothetical protein